MIWGLSYRMGNTYMAIRRGTPCIEMTRHKSHRNVSASVIVGMSGVKYVKIFDGASNGTEYTQFIAEATQSYTDEGDPSSILAIV